MGRLITISVLGALLVAVALPASAQRTLTAAPATPSSGARIALVIGNSAYKEAPLANPVNDATDVAQALRDAGFKVSLKRNAGTRDLRQAIREFGAELKRAEVGLFYFAGHGMQVRGGNYLMPVGADIQNEADVEDLAIDAAYVLRTMEDSQVKVSIVILDACRNNPFARSFRSASRGLAQMNAAMGSLVAFATAPGSVAADGSGRNGVYTKHLLASLGQPDTDILKVFQRTRAGVVKETGGKQVPWESTSLVGDFFFKPASAAPAQQLAIAAPSQVVAPPAPAPEKSAKRMPIAFAGFSGEADAFPGLMSLVRANLERTGGFRALAVEPASRSLTEASAVDYADWQSRSAEGLVLGSVVPRADGKTEVRLRVYDVANRSALGGVSYAAAPNQLRVTAHRVADYIYEKLSGERGVSGTRIAYVQKLGQRYALQIADSDGAGAETALTSLRPIASCAFSPDGREIAYVSYETSRDDRPHAVVYTHTLAEGKRVVSLNVRDVTSMTIAWIPGQRRLMALANRGDGTTFYTVTPEGTELKIVAVTPGVDSRPAFSPDGAWVYFTSARSGARQIHRIRADGTDAERVTAGRLESFSPAISPDGKTLAYMTRENGQTRLAVMDLASARVTVLGEAPLDEKLSFSPNGRFLVFATESAGQRVLGVVSSAEPGQPRWTLSAIAGAESVGEPAWGPYFQ